MVMVMVVYFQKLKSDLEKNQFQFQKEVVYIIVATINIIIINYFLLQQWLGLNFYDLLVAFHFCF